MKERYSEVPSLNMPSQPEDNAIPADVLAKLNGMDREGLIALIRLCNADKIGVALLTKEERMEAAKLKLWHGGLSEKEIYKALPALNAAMDREIGKPAQSIAMQIEDKSLDKVATEKLLRLASMLDDPVIIAPMPKKLDIDN